MNDINVTQVAIICCVLFLIWLVPLVAIHDRLCKLDKKLDEIIAKQWGDEDES